MLTTTPFFSPREACVPTPTTSTLSSAPISPTIATIFEVPISSPTIMRRSTFLTMLLIPLPAHGKAVGVTHIHRGRVAQSGAECRRRHGDETREHGSRVVGSQFDAGAAGERNCDLAARVARKCLDLEADCRQGHIRTMEIVEQRHGVAAIGAVEKRQLDRK